VAQGQKSSIQKIGGYTVSLNHKNTLLLLKSYKRSLIHRIRPIATRSNKRLGKIWEMSDITIEGDVKAQQGTVLIFSVKSNLFRKR
jgi:maltose phosphorylase